MTIGRQYKEKGCEGKRNEMPMKVKWTYTRTKMEERQLKQLRNGKLKVIGNEKE